MAKLSEKNIEFGNRLRKAMETTGFSNKELTEKLDISKNNIGNYLSGQVPNATILYNLSQLIGISMEYLLTGKETAELTPNEQELIELYRNTNDIGQPLITNHAKDIQKALPRQQEIKLSDSKIG